MRHHPPDGRDDGVTAVEYTIMASLIAVVIAGSVTLLGTSVAGLFASMPAGLSCASCAARPAPPPSRRRS